MNSAGKDRKIMTIGIGMDDPPYVYDDDSEYPGVLIELLQTMAHNLDLDIQFKRQPWNQRLQMIEMNEIDGNTFTSFTEERMKIGVFPMKDGKPDPSRRTMTLGYYFYKLKDSPFMWDGEAFLNLNGSLSAEKEAAIVDVLRAMGVSVEEAKGPPQGLSNLIKGHIVAYVELGTWADVHIASAPEKFRGVVRIPTPIREKPYYLMLSHKFVKEYSQLAEQIWDEIGRLREDKLKILEGEFSITFQRLRSSQQKLQQAHDTLEIRVRERTNDLTAANAEMQEYNERLKDEIEKRKQAEAKLLEIAITDPLTELYNRRHFFDLAEKEISRALRHQHPFSLLLIDVDNFKLINDKHGHLCGDRVLRMVAKCISQNSRDIDIIGRFGGDEFIVLVPETQQSFALIFAERLCQTIPTQVEKMEEITDPITLSIGITNFGGEKDITIDGLFERADQALYTAKEAGRNCVKVWQAAEST